jgi:hypothetical protein
MITNEKILISVISLEFLSYEELRSFGKNRVACTESASVSCGDLPHACMHDAGDVRDVAS